MRIKIVSRGYLFMKLLLKISLFLCSSIYLFELRALSPLSVEGELIVKFKKNNQNGFVQKYAPYGVRVVRDLNLSFGDFKLVQFNPGQNSLDSMVYSLSGDSEVEYVEPNFIYSLDSTTMSVVDEILHEVGTSAAPPSDPRFGDSWGFKNVGSNAPGGGSRGRSGADVKALQAWELTKGNKSVTVAVIDTGIDYEHPDLRENIWTNQAELDGEEGVDDDDNGFVDDIYGYDFSNNDPDPMDDHNHGTHCAGIIGAVHNNAIGLAGMMGQVNLMAIKFLSKRGGGTLEGAAKAIDYATQMKVDIMSNSWGGGGYSRVLEEAIKRAEKAGILFVAAAGNSAKNTDEYVHYPSGYEMKNVFSVGAHTAEDTLASFSNYGRKSVHLVAPGHKILSTVRNEGYRSLSGTSMATPFVSGALGLLMAYDGKVHLRKLKERLIKTSTPVASYRGKAQGSGRLNAYNLVTDTRPYRHEPESHAWKTLPLQRVWESEHPYPHKADLKMTLKVKGASFLRLKVKRFDLEKNYDFIKVREGGDTKAMIVDKITGRGTDYFSSYVLGDTLTIQFVSDGVVNRWGFYIEELQWQ